MDTDRYILAVHEICGRQNFIYQSANMQEMAGASLLIRDCFADYLLPAAAQVREKGLYTGPADYVFSSKALEEHLKEGYAGEVIYDSGGKLLALYQDAGVFREVNRAFSRIVLERTYSLHVLSTYVEIRDFSDCKGDMERLRRKHRHMKHLDCGIRPVNALPFVQVDRQSSLPLECRLRDVWQTAPDDGRISPESAAKYRKYAEYKQKNDRRAKDAERLDSMITRKGVDSHLAVLFMDVNKDRLLQRALEDCTDYDSSITALRKLSHGIRQTCIEAPMNAVDSLLQKRKHRRFAADAEDTVTLICNAKDAYEIVKTYFDALPDGASCCAGAAIFHSHAPYDEAYRIAKDCCGNGKRYLSLQSQACLLDFHYCQGAAGTSLENIRIHEGTEAFCRPWLLRAGGETAALPGVDNIPEKNGNGTDGAKTEQSGAFARTVPQRQEIEETVQFLQAIAHHNSKTLLYAAKDGELAFRREMARIRAHLSDSDKKKKLACGVSLKDAFSKQEQNRELIYRIMMVFDLWFRGETGNAAQKGDGTDD